MAALLLMGQAPAGPLPAGQTAGAAPPPLSPGRAAGTRRAQAINPSVLLTGLVAAVAAGAALVASGGGGKGVQPQSQPVTTTTATTG